MMIVNIPSLIGSRALHGEENEDLVLIEIASYFDYFPLSYSYSLFGLIEK